MRLYVIYDSRGSYVSTRQAQPTKRLFSELHLARDIPAAPVPVPPRPCVCTCWQCVSPLTQLGRGMVSPRPSRPCCVASRSRPHPIKPQAQALCPLLPMHRKCCDECSARDGFRGRKAARPGSSTVCADRGISDTALHSVSIRVMQCRDNYRGSRRTRIGLSGE